MRYQVKSESVLGHGCCFDATVIDTEKNDSMNRGFEIVCETFDIETAQRIADALNNYPEKK